MAKCIKIDHDGKRITGRNIQAIKNDRVILVNAWSKITWTSKTDEYYLIADDNTLEGC